MMARRPMAIAGIVIVVLAILISIGSTVWSEPNNSGAGVRPTGPAQDAAQRAKLDLASRLGVDAGEITVVTTEAHTWADASLGLPEPGMMYAQVLTEGYIVALDLDGRAYIYHVAGNTVRLNEAAN